jgi:GNAT superfamily N-acetyltransferase
MEDSDGDSEAFDVYRWAAGFEFALDDEWPLAEALSALERALTDRGLPEEFRVSGAAFDVRGWRGDALHLTHLQVFERRAGVGSQLIAFVERLGRAHDHEALHLWLGANRPGETEAFLDAHGFEYDAPTYDEAHGWTLAAEKALPETR